MQVYYDDDHDDHFFADGGDDDKGKYDDEKNNFKMEKAGIETDRCCTDILCLAIFWAFIGAMIYGTWYGFHNGQINKLTAPIDADNNFCGFGEMKDYPRMILTNFQLTEATDILKSGVCIKKCPSTDDTGAFAEGECKSNGKVKCEDHEKYATKDIFDFCLPTSADALSKEELAGYKAVIE